MDNLRVSGLLGRSRGMALALVMAVVALTAACASTGAGAALPGGDVATPAAGGQERRQADNGSQRRAAPQPGEELPTPTRGSIEVSPFDVLKVVVFGVPALSSDYPVDQSGVIKMPLLGEVVVAGKSPLEVSAMLEEKLGERYLQNADVNVTIAGGGASAMITVDGAVRTPGLYPVRGRLSLLQVIALAGGPAAEANQSRVLVFRTIEGRRHAAKFNLRDIRRGAADDPALFGNDIVVVDGTATSQVYQRLLRSLPLFSVFTAF